ncbi:MAG: isoprenyl transferase [Acidobacteriota bacterium]
MDKTDHSPERRGQPEEELFPQIDREKLPQHIAIIMDGNGRWAERRGLKRVDGHRAGIKAVREVVEAAARLGVKILTLYAFSVENWKRPAEEVSTLMSLLRKYIKKETPTLLNNNIKLSVLGRIEGLPRVVQSDLRRALEATHHCTGLLFNIALNYGGRTELIDAFRKIWQQLEKSKGTAPPIDEELIANNLYTAGQPDPDLLIRTSGEMRLSNFLLWQIAYSELWVTETLWPDFRCKELYEAIISYQKRERRFGGV